MVIAIEWVSRVGEKPLFLSWSSGQKCMKLEKKKFIERNSTKFYKLGNR